MTIHTPKDVLLSGAFKPKLMPPKRGGEDDTLLVDIAQLCLRAQNTPHLRDPLVELLGRIIRESRLEHISRTHPGMIGTLATECEVGRIE